VEHNYAIATLLAPTIGNSDTRLAAVRNPLGISGAQDLFDALQFLLTLGLFAASVACIVAVVLRFRRARGVERQQLKWFAYGTLTLSLTPVYFGLVIGLQALSGWISGHTFQSPVIVVVSTLVIAALFQPLRQRIQAIIDHRFYRRKYDAEKLLAAFSATLRNEVDLSELKVHLLAVVQETLQPVHVSLWVRKSTRTSSSSLQIGKPSSEEAGVREEIAGHGV
jgi:hypothetical protein